MRGKVLAAVRDGLNNPGKMGQIGLSGNQQETKMTPGGAKERPTGAPNGLLVALFCRFFAKINATSVIRRPSFLKYNQLSRNFIK